MGVAKKTKSKKELTKEELKAKATKRNARRLATWDPVKAACNALRREFARSPVVVEMMRSENTRLVPTYRKDGSRAKVDAREHFCNGCKQWKRSSKKKKVSIDHINPVVDPWVGFVDMNTFFQRLMLVPKSGLQKLCGDCHQTKSQKENLIRLNTLLDKVEKMGNTDEAREILRPLIPKKWNTSRYPKEFIARASSLWKSLKGGV